MSGTPPAGSTGDGPLFVLRREPPGGAGAELPVVLVHGSMDRSSSFARLTARLSERTVISYDRRGYARSARRAASERFSDQVEDLVEVLDGQPAVALGHSFGGGVVAACAGLHPELLPAVVIWEPPVPWLGPWAGGAARSIAEGSGSDPAGIAEAFMRRVVGDEVWEHLPERTRARRRAEGPTLVAEMRALRQPAWDPSQVDVPVLVGCGADSSARRQRIAAELARAFPAGELHTVAGVGHGAHLSAPGALARLVRRAAALAGEGRVAAARVGTASPDAPESLGWSSTVPGHEEDTP